MKINKIIKSTTIDSNNSLHFGSKYFSNDPFFYELTGLMVPPVTQSPTSPKVRTRGF